MGKNAYLEEAAKTQILLTSPIHGKEEKKPALPVSISKLRKFQLQLLSQKVLFPLARG